MALGDVQHVEAVALIRRMRHEGSDVLSDDVLDASHVFLEENHPSPAAYSAAARSLGDVGGVAEDLHDEADRP